MNFRPENGAVAVNIAGALANVIWHCRELQNKIPFESQNFEIYENKDRTCGLVPLLLSEDIDDEATVLTAMHNFYWNNQSNKIDLADSFLGPMEHELIRLRDHGGTTRQGGLRCINDYVNDTYINLRSWCKMSSRHDVLSSRLYLND